MIQIPFTFNPEESISPSLKQTDFYVSLCILKENRKYILVQLFKGKAER